MIGWTLLALAAGGLVAVGAAAVAAPAAVGSQFGIVLDDPRALAFVRAIGVRDVVIGVLLGLMATSCPRDVVAWALYAGDMVALVDLAVVTMDRRGTPARIETPAVPPRLLHAAGAICFGLAGAVLHAGY